MKYQKEKLSTAIPFSTATNRTHSLVINLPKEMREWYIENYKTLMKEIKDDINR